MNSIEEEIRWLQAMMTEKLAESDIPLLFRDIKTFKESGVVASDCALDRMERYFRPNLQHIENVRKAIIDAVTYMMADAYNDLLVADDNSSIAGFELNKKANKSYGPDVLLVHNLESMALWDYRVSIVKGPVLAYFSDEKSARDYIATHNYTMDNGGIVQEIRDE